MQDVGLIAKMTFDETSRWATLIFLVLLAIPFIADAAGSRTYRSEFLKEEDRVITSPNYPKPYPPNQNFTWLCNSTDVKWAVVFFDFQLDALAGNFREYDWFELDDGRKPLRYSSSSQPLVPYKSSGHHLRMTFITDSVSGGQARGFELQLLQGKDDREIAVKIHALKTRKTKKGDDDGNGHLLLIIVAVITAILFIAIILAIVLCFLHHRRVSRRTLTVTDRNAFGVRRNSGVYHSRNSESREQHTSEVVIVARQTHRVPSESQPSCQMAPVQRSNSQRDWRSRAELCATVTVSSQNSRPNMYSHSGPQPQACSRREPDKVPDFNSFDDDCCSKSRKNSRSADGNNAGGSTTTCKGNAYHFSNNLAAQNPSANQSACASLSKVAAKNKCNSNDYTNIHLAKNTNSKFTNQDKVSQEPGSPVYCNSPVSSPTSPDPQDGFTLNVRVGSSDACPSSPTDSCYENVSVCANQEHLDKTRRTTSVHLNKPENTQVKRKHSCEEKCQRTNKKDEFQTMDENQQDSKDFRTDGLENILEVKRTRPASINLYSNWENIHKESKVSSMGALPETTMGADNSSSHSSVNKYKPNGVNDSSLMAMANMQKFEQKPEERKISDPSANQMDTKTPQANTIWAVDVRSNESSQNINYAVPCNTEHEPQNSSRALKRQFTLELPAVNTGEYLYLTEFGISPHKPEKEWDKKVPFTDTEQFPARAPKLSNSQSIPSDEEVNYSIPNAQDRCENEDSAKAMAFQLDDVLPKTQISSLPPQSNANNFGEYHLLPLDNERCRHGIENTDNAISKKQSVDSMELQLNSKVPKSTNVSFDSPGNSGEYHFLPSSKHDKPCPSEENGLNMKFSPPKSTFPPPEMKDNSNEGEYHYLPSRHDKPYPNEENGLNMKFSPPNSTFPPPEMKDNSNEGEYHYLFQCKSFPENDQNSHGNGIQEQHINNLGNAVPAVSSSELKNPDDCYVVPRTDSADIDGQNEDVKFLDSGEYQLASKVPISNKLPDKKGDNCGEYHYLVPRDDQNTKTKAEG